MRRLSIDRAVEYGDGLEDVGVGTWWMDGDLCTRRELERTGLAVGGPLNGAGEDELTLNRQQAILAFGRECDCREVDVGVEVPRGLNWARVGTRESDRRVATHRWSSWRKHTATVSTSTDDEQRRPSTQEATHPHNGPPFRGDEHTLK